MAKKLKQEQEAAPAAPTIGADVVAPMAGEQVVATPPAPAPVEQPKITLPPTVTNEPTIDEKRPNAKPRRQNARVIVMQQFVEGDENTPGNVVLRESSALRKEIDALRQEAVRLREAGCQAKAIKDLYPAGYGFVITPPAQADGTPGQPYNLLALVRLPKPVDSAPIAEGQPAVDAQESAPNA